MTWATIGYLLAGQVVGGAGVALVLLALIGDRLRGNHKKRRCPKCRYDMVGTPGLVCPECGKAAKRESRLFRTRRRWGWAVVGMLAVLGGPVVGLWPWMTWMNAFPLLPARVQAEVWPWLEDSAFALRWLQSVKGSSEVTPVIRARVGKELRAWPATSATGRMSKRQLLVISAVEQLPSDPELDAALAAMARGGPWARMWVIGALEKHPGAVEIIVDDVVQDALFGPTPAQRQLAVRLLWLIAARSETAAQAMAEVVIAGDEVAPTAASGLIEALPSTRGVMDGLIAKKVQQVDLVILMMMPGRGMQGAWMTSWIADQWFHGESAASEAAGRALVAMDARSDRFMAEEVDRRFGRERDRLMIIMNRRVTHDPAMLEALERVALDPEGSFWIRRLAMERYNTSVEENRLAVEPLAVFELWGPAPKWSVRP